MTRIIRSLAEVSGAYDALLVDLWGCYHNGITPYPAAMSALKAYRAGHGRVVLLTNAPRPAATVQRFLERIGADPASYDGIMTSGAACQRAMESGDHGRAFHYVGPPRDLHMLTDLGLADTPLDAADAILCTGLADDMTETPADYAAEIAAWKARGLTLLCANPDLMVDRGERRIYCAGALARAYEAAGGRVVWFGKPHAPTYDQSFALLAEIAGRQVPRDRVLAVGDGIATDIRGALDYGLDAVFVTGGLAAAEMGGDPEHPDPALLDAWLAAHGAAPRFAMGRLR